MVLGTTFLLSGFVLLVMMGAGAGAGGGLLADVHSQHNAVQRRLLASTQLLGFTRVHVGRILSVALYVEYRRKFTPCRVGWRTEVPLSYLR